MLLISEVGKKSTFAWQMKIEMQIGSKYLTYLINNFIKIENGDDKDLQILCICITVALLSRGVCLCAPLDTSKYSHWSLRPFCGTYKRQFPNIQFGVTVMIKIISWQLELHVQDEVLLCIACSIRKKDIMKN